MSLPAGIAALLASAVIGSSSIAQAADYAPPPQQNQQQAEQKTDSRTFQGQSQAPAVSSSSSDYQLPEGNQWRYSEFINAVQAGKVERVRFSKDGSQLQLTAVDGRRALVILPNDPDLVDILAKNGVDISVSEGEQQGNYVALLGNLLFPIVAFAGLFFLFRKSGGQGGAGGGPMGGMGGPMDFGKSKSKFQEVPETGITFNDVAVSVFGPVLSPHIKFTSVDVATLLLADHLMVPCNLASSGAAMQTLYGAFSGYFQKRLCLSVLWCRHLLELVCSIA